MSFAQFLSADVGINGLTCSACSRSVEMSIRKLDFVQDVQMDLQNTRGKIVFKEGGHVSIDKLAKAVTDAGFSVRYLNALFVVDSVSIFNNNYFDYENAHYRFINAVTKKLSGAVTLTFIGKKYLPKKEYKKWKKEIKSIYANDKQKAYYVTL